MLVQEPGPDPRFGTLAPLTASSQVTSPAGLVSTVTRTRTMEPAEVVSLAEITSITDTVDVNGRVSTTVYDAATRTLTTTSPAARTSTVELDSLGRVVFAQDTDLAPLSLVYRYDGRLETVAEGTGGDARVTSLGYDPVSGYLGTVTDPLSRVWSFGRDGGGRVTSITRPDLAEIFERVRSAGAFWTRMAGSGSTIVGAFDSVGRRNRALERLSDSLTVIPAQTTGASGV